MQIPGDSCHKSGSEYKNMNEGGVNFASLFLASVNPCVSPGFQIRIWPTSIPQKFIFAANSAKIH